MSSLETYLSGVQRFGIQPGLERIQALLQNAGSPHQQYPFILVGGTNGKGSTCEFLAQMLARDGLRTGLYTSPHLYRWNERIRVLESAISENASKVLAEPAAIFPGCISDAALEKLFAAALPQLNAVAQQLGQPTEFETLTFLGFQHFAEVQVQAAVIEVGLGGRWDATNVGEPIVSVLTHVALDHCDRLGNTLELIAHDKVDIARPHRVLVTAETKPEVLRVLRDECSQRQARLWSFQAPQFSNDRENLEDVLHSISDVTASDATAKNATAAAFSQPWQHINYQTALMARRAFYLATNQPAPADATPELPLTVPGRMEILPAAPMTILDGANNPDGARHLAQFLQQQLTAHRNARLILVAGILADKDHAQMLQILAPLAHTVIVTQSHAPRAASATLLETEARQFCRQVEVVTPVNQAALRARQIAAPHDIICITGSFYTIAEVDRSTLQIAAN